MGKNWILLIILIYAKISQRRNFNIIWTLVETFASLIIFNFNFNFYIFQNYLYFS
ncbi:hypothetical protein BSPCLSOX_1936 [uncultured Gammaproteobacteria bacterium]|nr:hypothetical protein BSPCLSOX_1936 [uncultured Gammaproteobacteria bacterium]